MKNYKTLNLHGGIRLSDSLRRGSRTVFQNDKTWKAQT